MRDTASAIEADIAWTERQRQVLDLLARGKTNPEIADILGVSLAGAKWHVSEVISKLGVTSREEAAAWWQQRGSKRGQLTRALRGLLALPLTRIAGAAAGVAAVGAGVAFVALPLAASDGDEPSAQVVEPTPTAPAPLYSESEAADMARNLAVELMADVGLGILTTTTDPADETAQRESLECLHPQSGPPRSPSECGFRDEVESDYVVVIGSFRPAAMSVKTNVAGFDQNLEAPTNVWVFELARRPAEHPGADSQPDVLVAFEDGTGELLAGGALGLPSPDDDGLGTRLDSTTSGGVTFWLTAIRMSELPGPFSDRDEWCLGEIDSRGPAVGYGCGIPGGAGFEAVAVHNSQGFAHARGLVGDHVARIRLVTEDGQEMFVEPGPRPEIDGFPWRGFIAVAAGAEWFVTVEALDPDGNVIGAEDYANHPTNP